MVADQGNQSGQGGCITVPFDRYVQPAACVDPCSVFVDLVDRVFDLLVTPYLVLHDDSGNPSALIDLETQEIIDYSQSPTARRDSDAEHKELVADFRSEYLEAVEDAGESAFEAGLLFPAIPIVISKGIGVDIVNAFIERAARN